MDNFYYLSLLILVFSISLLLLKDFILSKIIKVKNNQTNKTKLNIINHFPYKPKPRILSETELIFYSLLKQILIDTSYIIFPKVRLSDILVVYDTNDFLKYENVIDKKSIDFLLCDKDTFSPNIAIILDDTNMNLDNPFFKDDELALIFKASALQLVRFKKYQPYTITDIKEKLNIKDKVLS